MLFPTVAPSGFVRPPQPMPAGDDVPARLETVTSGADEEPLATEIPAAGDLPSDTDGAVVADLASEGHQVVSDAAWMTESRGDGVAARDSEFRG